MSNLNLKFKYIFCLSKTLTHTIIVEFTNLKLLRRLNELSLHKYINSAGMLREVALANHNYMKGALLFDYLYYKEHFDFRGYAHVHVPVKNDIQLL